jgi:hypothetical protein
MSKRELKELQEKLNTETMETYYAKGGANDTQARYIAGIAQAVLVDGRDIFTPLKPRIVDHDEQQWVKSICYCIAYLRKYKMEKTLQTIKAECQNLPKSTGFSRTSELGIFWQKLLKTSVRLGDKTFDEWVIEYKEQREKLEKAEANKPKLQTPVLTN